MLDFLIRPATLGDVPEIQQLIELSAWALNAAQYSEAEIERALTWVYGVDTQLIMDGTYFAAISATSPERLIGCGGWSRRQKNFGGDHTAAGGSALDSGLLEPATDAAKIRAFFVHPDFARRGIGRKLLETCEAAAQSEGFIRFELTATLTGRELYATCGYTEQEPVSLDVPGYGPFPAILMQKQVQP